MSRSLQIGVLLLEVFGLVSNDDVVTLILLLRVRDLFVAETERDGDTRPAVVDFELHDCNFCFELAPSLFSSACSSFRFDERVEREALPVEFCEPLSLDFFVCSLEVQIY